MATTFDHRRGWVMNPDAPSGSFDEKRPYIDNGTARFDATRYFDPAYMRAEWERLWTRTWIVAGVAVDVAEPGDYFTFSLLRESFIIVRGADGVVRAHHNVCPHRGSPLVFGDFGHVGRFSCPFHGWTFELDGCLQQVRDAETFRRDAPCQDLDLRSARCEVLGGLVFITMNPDIGSVRETLGEVALHLEMYDIDQMKVIKHKVSEWDANWKTGIDAFSELYHLATVHPQTQGFMEDVHAQLDLLPGGCSRHLLKFALPSTRVADQHSINPGIAVMLADVGLDPADFEGRAQEARAAIQAAKRARAKRLGLDYDKFSDIQLSDSIGYFLFPNTHFGLHPEAVFVMRFLPHPTDPEKFLYDNIILYRPVDDPSCNAPIWMGLPPETDFDPAERPTIERVPPGVPPELGPVLDQDVELVAAVQRAMHSRGFPGPLWGEQEIRLRHMHLELDRYIRGEK